MTQVNTVCGLRLSRNMTVIKAPISSKMIISCKNHMNSPKMMDIRSIIRYMNMLSEHDKS